MDNCKCPNKNSSKSKKDCIDGDSFWQNVVEKYRRRKCKLEKREMELRNRLQIMENQMPMLLMMNLMKQLQEKMPGGFCGKKGKREDERKGCRKYTELNINCTDDSGGYRPTNKGEFCPPKRAASTSSPYNIDCSCSGGQISIQTLDSTDNMCVQALYLLTSNERCLKEKIEELEEQEAALSKTIEEATGGLGLFDGGGSGNVGDLKKRNEQLARENQLLKERQCLMYKGLDESSALAESSKRLDSAIRECEASDRKICF